MSSSANAGIHERISFRSFSFNTSRSTIAPYRIEISAPDAISMGTESTGITETYNIPTIDEKPSAAIPVPIGRKNVPNGICRTCALNIRKNAPTISKTNDPAYATPYIPLFIITGKSRARITFKMPTAMLNIAGARTRKYAAKIGSVQDV